jgi:hypothetical protein
MKFDLELNGNKEFHSNCSSFISNKKYYVLKVDTKEKETFMNDKFIEFIKSQEKNRNKMFYIGIDFEFNKVSRESRDVALMQINLENDISNDGMIFVLYPPDLNDNKYLISLITNRNIIKILHGAESLDIPYMFDQLLITKENIDNFCNNFYDTKFLCDYMNLMKPVPSRCSIYYLLQSNNIITQKKFDELEKIEDKTGPIYLIHINIYKLNFDVLRYSLYDVLYLPELIKKFFKLNDIYYKNIIPEISCLVNKYKRNVEKEFNILSDTINKFNIFYIIDNGTKILIKDIWEMYFYTYYIKMNEIHYFKFFFEIITKFIVYYNLIIRFKVYSSNNNYLTIRMNNIYDNKIILIENIDTYFKWFGLYPEFNKIILNFNKMIKNDINLL